MAFKDNGLTAESELLLCCARTRLNDEALERVRTLSREELDWGHVTRTALTHGVAPLLYSNLRAICPGVVPKTSLDQLRDHYRANVQHSFLLTAELLRLLELFETHGIHAIPFKGPVLAASAYRDFSLRQFSDLDLLVHKENISEAARLLVSAGYQSGSTHGEVSEHDIDHDEVAFHEPTFYTFSRPDGLSRIDLQWRVTERYFSFSLDKERLWQRLVPVEIGRRAVRTFGPTDMLLILCVHGSKHRWERLKWVCDVTEMVRSHKSDIDWDLLQQEALRQRVERMLRVGLALAHQLLGAEVPEPILTAIRADKRTRRLVPEIRERLLSRADQPPDRLKRIRFYLKTKDRWRDRAQFCLRYVLQWAQTLVVPTSIERRILPLPAYCSFLYFFFRPLRLLGKHGSLAVTRTGKKRPNPATGQKRKS